MIDVARKKLFLSHAGEDADFAFRLVQQIETEWQLQGHPFPEVFCTSHPEHRFKELQQIMHPGANLREESQRWEEELRQYLRKNLVGSEAYFLLVTKRSLRKNSAWIAFEIDVADELARERGLFFFPLVAEGATLGDLPGKAKMFQGIELASKDAVRKLLHASARRPPN